MSSPSQAGEKTLFGHPVGLFYLSFTEAWERFSYYGMQTLLVLYMTKQLLFSPHVERIAGFHGYLAALQWLPTVLRSAGHCALHMGDCRMLPAVPLSTMAIASQTFGWYTSLVYLTPILGGLLADRVLGRTKTVTIGAILMSIGHFLMAFDASFLLALLCLLLGSGCFKGNIATQVGDLYAKGDNRRADAFQFYMFGIQVAVIVAPLVTGGLGQGIGWHWGFGAAGVGMVIGLLIYLGSRRYLPPEPEIVRDSKKPERPKLAPGEGRSIWVLVLLLPVLALAALGNQQMGDAYLVWGDKNLQLTFFGFNTPVTWLTSLDAIISAITMAGAVLFWRWWSSFRTEPNEITKLTIGAAIAAVAPLFLAIASLHPAGQRASIGWAIAFHIVNDIGFANVFPVGLALYSRAAPKAIGATMIAVFYLHLVICNQLVGQLGGLLDSMPGFTFWMMHACLVGAGAVLFLVFRSVAGRILAPAVDPEAALAAAPA
jgi:POT family proton-dependent oligopeptide transporter